MNKYIIVIHNKKKELLFWFYVNKDSHISIEDEFLKKEMQKNLGPIWAEWF